MRRHTSKYLGTFVFLAAALVAPVQIGATSAACACSRAMPIGQPDAQQADDAARLAGAYRDVIQAEQALRNNPAADATFGAMLREARARLEAGIAALAQSGVALEAAARLLDISNATSGDLHAPLPTHAPNPPSNTGLQLRRRAQTARLIWV